MSTSYIYPEWMQAKRKLIQALVSNPLNTPATIGCIVEDFFRRHVFQIGMNITTRDEARSQGMIDMDRENRRRAAHMLADKMLDHGCYMKETFNSGPGEQTVEYRVLIFGAPAFVGPGTRESCDEGDKK